MLIPSIACLRERANARRVYAEDDGQRAHRPGQHRNGAHGAGDLRPAGTTRPVRTLTQYATAAVGVHRKPDNHVLTPNASLGATNPSWCEEGMLGRKFFPLLAAI